MISFLFCRKCSCEPLERAAWNERDAIEMMQGDVGLQHTFAAQTNNHTPFERRVKSRGILRRQECLPALIDGLNKFFVNGIFCTECTQPGPLLFCVVDHDS